MELRPEDLKWCVRRLPKSLVDEAHKYQQKIIIAGGFIRSCIANEPVSDIDLFVGDKTFGKSIASNLGGDRFFESPNAYTVLGIEPIVQIIHRWLYNTPEEVVASFDFTIASAAIWYNGKEWQSICDERYYADLAAKRLVYRNPVRNEDAGGSMLRVLKFYQRGYRIPLDSLGRVIERLTRAVRWEKLEKGDFNKVARILTSLLVEVDPNAIRVFDEPLENGNTDDDEV